MRLAGMTAAGRDPPGGGATASSDSRQPPGYLVAHLSDPHLPHPLPLAPSDLFRKRLIGYLSWRLKRRHIHRGDVLAAVTDDLLAASPDHIVVTGDIVNISLAAEFAAASDWLARLGPPDWVTAIPGNHDAYVAIARERSWAAWQAYMSGDLATAGGVQFPIVRRRREVAIIGLSTAVPSPPGFASGILGTDQLAAAEQVLTSLGAEGLFRLLLIHHPPVPRPRTGAYKHLTDAEALRAMIRRAGAELILHGHDHVQRINRLPGRDGEVPVIGVASASALPVDGHPPAQYHLYRILRSPSGWAIEMRVRQIDAALRMSEATARRFSLSRQFRPHQHPAEQLNAGG